MVISFSPSGTEDVVRIYAEAATDDDTHSIASEVEKAIHEILNMNGGDP